jgi:uncharacterized protein
MYRFEWDEDKAELNFAKHGVSFLEASSVWLDPFSLGQLDSDHSDDEERWIHIGFSRMARLILVIYIDRAEYEKIRIISARKATRLESEKYIKEKL